MTAGRIGCGPQCSSIRGLREPETCKPDPNDTVEGKISTDF